MIQADASAQELYEDHMLRRALAGKRGQETEREALARFYRNHPDEYERYRQTAMPVRGVR